MNTHISRWKHKTDLVQKVYDALPESRDQTVEVPADGKSPKTVSENSCQEDEEKKGEEEPWADQESTLMNEASMIPEKKVTEGSKAGAAQPLPKSEPQERPQSAMITPAR